MSSLVTLPLVLPLALAAVALLALRRVLVQRALSYLGAVSVTVTGFALTSHVLVDGPVATSVGDFPGPIAIPLVVDGWSAVMITVTGVIYLAALTFAWFAGEDTGPAFHPLVMVLLAGIGLAFTTGDLFNLFVSFEVMLIASYALAVFGSGAEGRRATFTYIAVNIAASSCLLIGAGLVYGVLGSVNLGVLAGTVADVPQATLALAFPLIAFAIKAGLVPVNAWVATTYTRISPAVAALFSGLLTKVGIYALYRIVTLLFPHRPGIGLVFGGVAIATMLIGVLQAVGQGSVRRILSFHITSQVGYMVMGLALGGVAGIAGGIAYTVHHIVVKSALFLVAGTIRVREGTEELAHLAGLARRAPALSIAFLVSAAALAGLPPLSGFIPKLALLQVAFGRGWWLLGGISLLVSLVTLMSMLKILTGVFWGAPSEAEMPAPGSAAAIAARPAAAHPRLLAAPALALAAIAVVLGLGAGPLLEVATVAAEQLVDPAAYVDAILEGGR